MALLGLAAPPVLADQRVDGRPDPSGALTTSAPVPTALPGAYDLRTAIDTALRHHPAVEAAQARTQAMRTGISAQDAAYRPFLAGTAIADWTLVGDRVRVIDGETVSDGRSGDSEYTGALSLVVPLVREGRLTAFMDRPSSELARARYEVSYYGHERRVRSEVVGAVSVAFYAALAAREALGYRALAVTVSQRALEDTRTRHEQGLLPRAEVMAADAALATAEAELAAARAALKAGLGALTAALGLRLDRETLTSSQLVDDTSLPPAEPLLDGLLARAVTSHPLVLAQEARVRGALAARRHLDAERLPTLDFRARAAGTERLGVPGNADEKGLWSLSALLRLDWKIFDFGRLDLRLRQQDEIIQSEQRELEETRRKVAAAVTDAHWRLAESLPRLRAAEVSVALTEELLRATSERLQQEVAAEIDVLRAELKLSEARTSFLQARYMALSDHARLRAATGEE